jgi:hypothetical protein
MTKTKSVCPECQKKIDAQLTEKSKLPSNAPNTELLKLPTGKAQPSSSICSIMTNSNTSAI